MDTARSWIRRIDTQAHVSEGLDALCRGDPRLETVRAAAGDVPLRRRAPGFASMAGIIVAQQVSRASADAILGRLAGLVDPLTPGAVLAAGEGVLMEAGLSRAKQRALVALAEALDKGALDLEALCHLDAGEAVAAMTAIRGVGPWTAEVYLLTAAGHRDVFPAGDVALQGAVADAFALATRPDARALGRIAEQWAPWRSVAARLFWAYYRERRGREAAPAA